MKEIINEFKNIISLTGGEGYIVGDFIINKLINPKTNYRSIDFLYTGNADLLLKELKKRNCNSIEQNSSNNLKFYKDDKIIRVNTDKTIADYLNKKSFTFETIALKLIDNKIIDSFGGRLHLQRRIIQEINDKSIESDPLSILKGVENYINLGMHFSIYTEAHIREYGYKLKTEEGNSVFNKLMEIIALDKEGVAFEVLDQYLVLKNILPYVEESKTIGKCKYHVEDVFTHMNTVYEIFKELENEKIVLEGFKFNSLNGKAGKYDLADVIALAGFLHDIGKYKSYSKTEDKISFANHQIIGEEIMQNVLDKYSVDKGVKDIICNIIKAHMYPLRLFKQQEEPENYRETLKEFIENYEDYLVYILIISFCDIWATCLYYDPEKQAEKYKQFIEKLLKQLN